MKTLSVVLFFVLFLTMGLSAVEEKASAPAQTKLLVTNKSGQDVTVYLTLGAVNGCIQDVSQIPFVTNKRHPLQGSFVLKAGKEVSYTPPQGTCFNGNLAFGSAPSNCAPAAYPFGINLFEFMLNNSGTNAQETVDISCVAGANALIKVNMSGGGNWNAGPTYPNVTTFKNKSIGDNTGLVGVYPYACDVCTASKNPPQCPNPPVGAPNPPKPQAAAICNVQRDTSLSGGTVEVLFNGFTSTISKITLGPQVPTQTSTDGQANFVPSNTTVKSDYSWFCSPNQKFILILQEDGNLVLYLVIGTPHLKQGTTITVSPIWDAKSTPQWNGTSSPIGDYLTTQNDGNLCIYPQGWPTNPGIWSWPDWTSKATNASLYLRNDGALVLYNGTNLVWTISPAQG